MSLKKGLTGALGGAGAGSVAGPWGAAAGGALGLTLGLFSSDDEAEAAKAAQQAAFAEIMALDAPPNTAREILLKKFEQAGVLTPELEAKVNEIDPVLIKENAQNRQMQMEVANKYKSLSETGMSPEDYALQNKLQNEAAQLAQSRQASILQRAQMEGRGVGAGADLAAQLLESQAGANREKDIGLEVGAQASRRALEALAGYGNMAGNIREGDYRTEAANTGVQNEFNRFKTTNQIEKEKRRVAAENAAREFNVKRGQDVSDANVKQANEESQRQRSAEGTDWKNQAYWRNLRAGAYGDRASQHQAAQQRSDEETKGLFDAGMSGIKGAGQLGLFGKQTTDQSVAKQPKSIYEEELPQSVGPLSPEEIERRKKARG